MDFFLQKIKNKHTLLNVIATKPVDTVLDQTIDKIEEVNQMYVTM